MRRVTRIPDIDVCPGCRQTILTTNWDDYYGIDVTPYRVDPTPLTDLDEISCVIAGRATYLLEVTAARTWRLSIRDHRAMHRHRDYPNEVVPHHLCGARYPSTLPPELHTNSFIPANTDDLPF